MRQHIRVAWIKMGSIWRAVLAPVLFPPTMRAFLRTRRLSIILIALSALSLVGLMWSAKGFLRIESRMVPVGLYTSVSGGEFCIDGGRIIIEKGHGTDRLTVRLSFRKSRAGAAALSVRLPANLREKRPWQLSGVRYEGSRVDRDTTGQSERWYSFGVADIEYPSCTLEFEGQVVSSDARELHLEFAPDMNPPEVPVGVMITNLADTEIDHLTPTPQYRAAHMIAYEPLPWNQDHPELIFLQIRDRDRAYQADFRFLITGVLIGVFSSILATAIWDVVKQIEDSGHSSEQMP